MIRKIKNTIDKHGMLKRGDRVVVALSGGADSCALLSILAELAQTYELEMIVAHFNHGLRGKDSEADEKFCGELAKKMGLCFISEDMSTCAIPRGMSAEDYYRRERYRFLDSTALTHGANKIALGHHLQDQAETVLLNLLRGCGLDGLKGFLPVRDHRYIRPLMEVSRAEILMYLKQNGLSWCEDRSNFSDAYLRNAIRLDLLPHLKRKYNPKIEEGLSRMADILRRDDEVLNALVDDVISSPDIIKGQGGYSFSAAFFNALPLSLRYRLVKALLENSAPGTGGFSYTHVQSVVDLAGKSATGKKIVLPLGLVAKKDYDRMIIGPVSSEAMRFEYELSIPGEVFVRERNVVASVWRTKADQVDFSNFGRIFMDEDKISKPLMVRNRRNGDWFEPLGTDGRQKVKKLLIDRKIPVGYRDRLVLLADGLSVIWIEGIHLSGRVGVTQQTRKVLVFELKPRQENI